MAKDAADKNVEAIKQRVAAANSEPVQEIETDDFPANNDAVSQLLAQANEASTGLLPLPDDGVDYSRQLDESDVIFPRVRLTQGLSKAAQKEEDPVRLGNWHLSAGLIDLGKTIKVTPIDMYKTRSLFVKDAGMMCRSMDFVHGVGMPGIVCATCALKDWTEGENGKRIPPKCSVNYNYMALITPTKEMEDEDLQVFNALTLFSRTGTPVARDINSKKAQNRKLPWHRWTYTLSSRPGKGSNPYQEPFIVSVEKTSADNIARCEEILEGYSDEELREAVNRSISVEDKMDDDDNDDE